ncbi:MAG: DegT/DnrJ/EryC1/StrS family aminotransferase [Candidatus Hydrogenedentes bacterium]|nr:DegT/DnrJ/EryC1/StrS family aminotransferase [Candidatus Hydrogenedentota bacterium]
MGEVLALLGGEPVRGGEKAWPVWPVFDRSEEAAVLSVLRSGKWWYGEEVAAFEREFAAFQDAKYCVSCSNGTVALEIVLQALGIGPGDEVLVPPYTFVATASAVMRVGATPVFVDVDASWCLDVEQVAAAVTPRTKALMPVHFGGRVCDMERMRSVAVAHGLVLIEDACHSWGSKWQGKGTGALGRCGVFSFQHSKNITSGEGGAIVTDDEELADLCRSIANCGRGKDGPWYYHVNIGTNARITEMQGALLRAQLSRLESQTVHRERNGQYLDAALGAIAGLTPQAGDTRITRRAYHLYCLHLDAARFGCSRAQFIRAAEAEGLTVSAGYPITLCEQPAIQKFYAAQGRELPLCPVAHDLSHSGGMWLLHAQLLGSEEDMEDVVAIVEKIQAHAASIPA